MVEQQRIRSHEFVSIIPLTKLHLTAHSLIGDGGLVLTEMRNDSLTVDNSEFILERGRFVLLRQSNFRGLDGGAIMTFRGQSKKGMRMSL